MAIEPLGERGSAPDPEDKPYGGTLRHQWLRRTRVEAAVADLSVTLVGYPAELLGQRQATILARSDECGPKNAPSRRPTSTLTAKRPKQIVVVSDPGHLAVVHK